MPLSVVFLDHPYALANHADDEDNNFETNVSFQ